MIKLTKEQRAALAPYESQLNMAYRADYVVGLSLKAKRDVLWPIYKELYGTHAGNMACGMCTVTVAKKLGALYFAEGEETAENAPVAHKTPSDVNYHPEGENAAEGAKNTQKQTRTETLTINT